MIGALAEFERAIIIERTSAGLKAAKARGVQLGRKPSLTPAQIKHARKLIKPAPAKAGGGENSPCPRTLGVDRSTLYCLFQRPAPGHQGSCDLI